MALTGVLRPGHVALRVLDLDEAIHHYVNVLGLIETGRDAQGRIYLKAWDEHDHHSVVLRKADRPGMDYMGWRVDSPATLKKLAADIEACGLASELKWIPAGEHLHCGERYRFTVPTGHVMELFAEKDKVGNGMSYTNPDPWPDGLKGMAPSRFDHCLLYGDDLDGTRQAVPRGARLHDGRAGDGRRHDDRRLPHLLEQGARRGLHPPRREEQVPPLLVHSRRLERRAARRRHHLEERRVARHRPDAPRHHARRDDLLLRPVGQPQRGVFPAAISPTRTSRRSPGRPRTSARRSSITIAS